MSFDQLWKSTILLIAVTGILAAQETTVPLNLQGVLIKKILGFDKALSGKSAPQVTVIGGGDDIVSALNAAGLSAKAGSEVAGDAVYVAPGATAPKAASAKAGILSISGVAAMAEKGQVSVAIGSEGGKPKILVHLGQLKAEGHELSADLLKLAKVIQ
jgi:hypothetical protein